ncbi:hypothetical protein WJX81_007756 [Elliptochloris bilobata]|uniref:Uncharacterized protein n=1 Tax=Elliptochloris bilobata TaxID=381761 RepID=A0AAW1S4H8_9CHLO
MFLGKARANPDATASVSIVTSAKPCHAAGVQASACAPERTGGAHGSLASGASARVGFQPYQAVLCLDSNGAPVDRFCPQPSAAAAAVVAGSGGGGADDIARDAAQARGDDEALTHLVEICSLLRRVPGNRASAYAVPQQVLRELPVSMVRAAERSVRQRCARLCFQEFHEYQRAQALCVLVPPAGSPPSAEASPEEDAAPATAPAAPVDLSAAIFAAADATTEDAPGAECPAEGLLAPTGPAARSVGRTDGASDWLVASDTKG